MPNFEFPAFISYSSKDRPWAIRMKADLQRALGREPFLDRDGLRAGREWKEELKSKIDASQHLVVLYSKEADDSQWVNTEMTRFDTIAGQDKQRLLLCVYLDEATSKVYGDLQGVVKLREAGLYARGIAELEGPAAVAASVQAWDAAVAEVAEEIRAADRAEPIPVAVVALNAAEAAKLDWNQADPGGGVGVLADEAQRLGIPDLATLKARYGATRWDWKPFGGKRTVRVILGDVLGAINKRLGRTFRWRDVEFLSAEWEVARQQVAAGLTGRALIIIDPLSLYSPGIVTRYTKLLPPAFQNRDAVVLVLTPFTPFDQYTAFRRVVSRLGSPHLDPYFEPPFPDSPRAVCEPGLTDDTELTRLVLKAFSTQATPPVKRNPWTGAGRGRSRSGQ